MKKTLLFVLLISFGVTFAVAQKKSGQSHSAKINIHKSIDDENQDSATKITIHQDERVDDLLNKYNNRVEPGTPYSGAGYRVQVFSSNDYKTAKNDAARVERQIRSAFPAEQVYVVYASPFWKVRVGNFRTAAEAQKLKEEIVKIFPELRQNSYAVKENNVKVN